MSRIAVFAPSPVLTITIERDVPGEPEIHLHAGGQGFWVARMATTLGAEVTMCAPFGGETGTVLRALVAAAGIAVAAAETRSPNGCYVHDRDAGERSEVAATPSASLARHELDELYGATLTAGLDAEVTLLTGPRGEDIVSSDAYERLSADLRANGRTVLADLTGPPLRAALRGGVDLLKLSAEELVDEGLARSTDREGVVAAAAELRAQGADQVLVSREAATTVSLGERLLEASGPTFSPLDPAGAGDSMFAALGVATAAGDDPEAALRLAVAAGALNVTRHGLGSGRAAEIERLRDLVEIRSLDPGSI